MRTAAMLLLLAIVAVGGDASAKRKQRSGYHAVVLHDHKGQKTSLQAQAAGQRLVAVVMKGTWCRVCVQQLVRLAGRMRQLRKLQTRVVALTTEAPKKNAALAKKQKLGFTIASDPKHIVLSRLGLWRPAWGHPLPAIVVFDKCGRERARLEGRSPNTRVEHALLRYLREIDKKPEKCARVIARAPGRSIRRTALALPLAGVASAASLSAASPSAASLSAALTRKRTPLDSLWPALPPNGVAPRNSDARFFADYIVEQPLTSLATMAR